MDVSLAYFRRYTSNWWMVRRIELGCMYSCVQAMCPQVQNFAALTSPIANVKPVLSLGSPQSVVAH